MGGSQVTALLKWSLLLMNVDVFTEVSVVLTLVGQRGICYVHIGLPNGLGMTHSYTITIYLYLSCFLRSCDICSTQLLRH